MPLLWHIRPTAAAGGVRRSTADSSTFVCFLIKNTTTITRLCALWRCHVSLTPRFPSLVSSLTYYWLTCERLNVIPNIAELFVSTHWQGVLAVSA
jgi:hypothetical protein